MPKKEQEIALSIFSENYQTMTKEEIINQYESDHDFFLEVVKKIPPHRINQEVSSNWGVKEIAGHIAWWNIETTRGVKTVIQGNIPWFLDDEEKINEINKREAGKVKGMNLEQVLGKVEESHKHLINFLSAVPDTSFQASFGQIWKGQKVTPSLVCSYRHYIHHGKDILEWLKSARLKK